MEKSIKEELVETIDDHHKDPKYNIENPAQTIPMLEDGYFKILGGSPLIYSYLMKRYQTEVGDKLMPNDLDLAIKGILGWHNAKLRPASEQLNKIRLEYKSYSSPPTLNQYNKWKSEFVDAFEAIDGKLKKDDSPYLCGRTMTLADLIIFNELS